MSHSTGMIKRYNGELFYIEYNGTVDVCLPNLYKTYEERDDNWRKQEWKTCSCKPITREEVDLAVTYGGGYYWKAFICTVCMVITDRFVPHDYEQGYEAVDGLPEWYPDRDEILEYFK